MTCPTTTTSDLEWAQPGPLIPYILPTHTLVYRLINSISEKEIGGKKKKPLKWKGNKGNSTKEKVQALGFDKYGDYDQAHHSSGTFVFQPVFQLPQ